MIDEADEGDLRGVALDGPVEHRFAGKEAAHRDAVEAAHQFAVVVPRLDAVGPPHVVQSGVGADDLVGDPAAVTVDGRAGGDDLGERGVVANLVAAARLAERSAHAERVEREDAPRIG